LAKSRGTRSPGKENSWPYCVVSFRSLPQSVVEIYSLLYMQTVKCF
jgi:hypothetical protein